MGSARMLSLVSEQPEQIDRVNPRFSVLLMAKLMTTANEHMVKLRDISSSGALIQGDQLPPPGTDIILRRGGLELFAEVIWRKDDRAGLEFDGPLSDAELWKQVNAPTHREIPDSQLVYRRPGFRGDQVAADERALARAKAVRDFGRHRRA